MKKVAVLTKPGMVKFVEKLLEDSQGNDVEFSILNNHKGLVRQADEMSAVFSIQYHRIVDRDTLDGLDKMDQRIINVHFAPLPKYRGMYPIAHALINGEDRFGITYHAIDPGIDTGSIFWQEMFDIGDEDTAEILYGKCLDILEKSFPKVLKKALSGNIKDHFKEQDNTKASYYNKHSLDFSKPVVSIMDITISIWNRYRAFYFPKFQRPLLMFASGRGVRIDRIKPIYAHSSRKAGKIASVGKEGVIVETLDGAIAISSIEKDGKMIDSPEEVRKELEAASR